MRMDGSGQMTATVCFTKPTPVRRDGSGLSTMTSLDKLYPPCAQGWFVIIASKISSDRVSPLCAGMVPVDPQDVRFVVCIPPVRRDGSLFDLGVQYLTERSSL